FLSHPAVQRHRNAQHLDAAADELRQESRSQSLDAGHDLGVWVRWKDLCLSIGGFNRGVLVWIFRNARPSAGRPAANADRVHCDSFDRAVLLAANWHPLMRSLLSVAPTPRGERKRSARSSWRRFEAA